MRRIENLGLAAAIAASTTAAAPGYGATQQPSGNSGTANANSSAPNQTTVAQNTPVIASAGELFGHEVRAGNVHGAKVGKIKDALIDPASGQLVAWLVASGSKITAVPARICIPNAEFTYVTSSAYVRPPSTDWGTSWGGGGSQSSFMNGHRSLIAMCNESSFRGAPGLPRTSNLADLDVNSLKDSFRHFGMSVPDLITAPDAKYGSAAQLIGSRVFSQNGEALGHIQDVTLDMSLRRAIYLVIQPSVGPERRDSLYLVPPAALQVSAESQQLVLNADQPKFLAGPRIARQYPAEAAQPELASAVYAQYGMGTSPYAFLGHTGAGRFATTPSDASIPPTPTGRSDTDISSEYLVELGHLCPPPNSPEHAAAIRDGEIQVIQVPRVGPVELFSPSVNSTVRDGKITLKGDVRTENQKRQIVAAATRVVGPGNVEDQLQVR
jgi:sporulation protein YlmC with PRC-barrel domain